MSNSRDYIECYLFICNYVGEYDLEIIRIYRGLNVYKPEIKLQ